MRRKKEASKVKQTRQSNTAHPKQSLFLEKNELPRVGLEPTTLYTLDRALYQLSYRSSSAGWSQISHLIVHLMQAYHQLNVQVAEKFVEQCVKSLADLCRRQGLPWQVTACGWTEEEEADRVTR